MNFVFWFIIIVILLFIWWLLTSLYKSIKNNFFSSYNNTSYIVEDEVYENYNPDYAKNEFKKYIDKQKK